jgi:hypothetical protein
MTHPILNFCGVGVWSGKVELYNLALKPAALDGLNLPLSIIHGSLKSLKLKVPWTALESKPVRVTIDGVYLLAGPLDVSSLSKHDIMQRTAMDRRTKLVMAEESALLAGTDADGSHSAAEKTTYIQQLTAKIVDNLEVTLTNVHIRYEDTITVPGTTLAAGLTLDRIALATTDSNWREMFVSRVEKDKTLAPSIHKLGKMENLAVYWNTRADRLDEMTEEEWETEMKALIFKTVSGSENQPPAADNPPVVTKLAEGKGTMTKFFTSPARKSVLPESKTGGVMTATAVEIHEAQTTLMYLIPPPNKLEVKIIHTDNAQQSSTPKIDLSVEISSLRLDLDKVQYQQLMSTIRMFTELEKQKLVSLHRPAERPSKAPRDWWKYAYHLVSGKHASFAKNVETVMLCCRHRAKYIKLVKNSRLRTRSSSPAPKPGSSDDKLIKEEEAMINKIEEVLPLHTLIVYRQIAALEICKEEKQAKDAKSAADDANAGGVKALFSKWFGGKSKPKAPPDPAKDGSMSPSRGPKVIPAAPASDDEDDILMELIQSQFQVKPLSAANQVILKMNLQGGLAVSLSSDGLAMCRLELALSLEMEVKSDAFEVTVSLFDFIVEDLCTSRAIFPYIIVSQSQARAALEASGRNRSVLGSGERQSTPQCVVRFDSTVDSSLLTIRATPVEIIWNEICIQRIISMFVSSTDASSVLSNPLLVRAVSRIASDAAVPPTLDMNIEIHIDAPKFIIPENAESLDAGCMILDMGVLDVKGRIAPSGDIYFDFALSSVNVGMPESTSDRYQYAATAQKDPEKRLYLVTPFNISVVLQNEDKSAADMSVVLDVTNINAQLSADKIVRILRITNIITRTINSVFTEETSDGDGSLQVSFNDRGESFTPDTITVYKDDPNPGVRKKPTDVLVDILLKSPSISAELLVTDKHYVTLSVTSLVTKVVQRSHDVVVDFSLTSLYLEDSLRSDSQRSIIGTKLAKQLSPSKPTSVSATELRQHLCSVTISSLFSKHSPLFETLQVGTDISLQFSKIYVNVDELAILRLCPLAKTIFEGLDIISKESEQYSRSRELLEKAASRKKKELAAAQGRRQRKARHQLTTASDRINILTGNEDNPVVTDQILSPRSEKGRAPTATGVHVSCMLSSVSLTIMRTHDQVLAVNVLNNIVDLQLAYSAEIAGLTADVLIRDPAGTAFKLKLVSFSVTDRRPSSDKFVYKKLFSRSTFASEYSSVTGSTSNTVDEHSIEFGALKSIGDKEVRNYAKEFERLASTSDSSSDADNILSIEYCEQAKGQSTVDVKIREITSILSVETVMDLVELAIKNVDAVMKFSEACVIDPLPATKHTPPLQDTETGATVKSLPSPPGGYLTGTTKARDSPHPRDTSSLSLNLNIMNPRLIILENPACADARAIVFRTEVCVTYSTVTEDATLMDVQERLNVALQGTEAFVLVEGLKNGAPQQVVEPTTISALFNRRMEGSVLLHCKAALVAQDIIAKLSLNDIQLINKMLKGVKQLPETSVSHDASGKKKLTSRSSPKNSLTDSISMFDLNVELGNINLLAINDSNDLYQPVLKLAMDNCSFDARGAPKGGELQGDGAVIISVQFFNNTSSTWEPVLERCRPCIALTYSFLGGLVVEVNHDRTFQLNVSGQMAKQVSLFLGLLKRIGLDDDDSHNVDQHAVIFYNELGIPVEISNSSNGNPLVYLMDANPVPLPIEKAHRYLNRSIAQADSEIPAAFNLRALGAMENERKPILGLPLNISRPQPHYLRPAAVQSGGVTVPTSGLSPMRSTKHAVVDIGNTEPIVEEVYENQRYNALQAKWKATAPGGLLKDPHNFTDSQGHGDRDLRSVQLPGERWEWVQSDWAVDKHAVVGKEIDADGWEYATGFGAFSASKQRRTQQPFDVVRRRKWVRSRVLKSTPKDNSTRALVLFWDVEIDDSGFRHIHIRSAMQLTNQLPCPLEIMLYGFQNNTSDAAGSSASRETDAVILDPIQEGQTLSVPLVYSHASFIRFRLCTEADPPLQWSTEYDCRIMSGGRGRTGFSELLKEIHCFNGSSENPQAAFFQGLFKFSDKALTMTCAPFITIYNHLPCDYLFRCALSGNAKTQSQASVNKSGEYGLVAGGGKAKLLMFDCKSPLKLQLQVGSFMWSASTQLSNTSKSSFTVDMLSPSDETGGMSISVNSDLVRQSDGYKVLELHVFCSYMLVDRSGLNVSIRTKRTVPQPVNVGAKVNANNFDREDGIVSASKIVERRSYGGVAPSDVKGSWIEGGNHVVLFQSEDNTACFGVNKGRSWSDTLSLQSMGNGKIQFEVIDQQTCSAYQLAFSVTNLPGSFQATQLVQVVACYAVVNTTGENVQIRQAESSPGSVETLNVPAMASSPWHRMDASAGTSLHIRSDFSDWSLGSIDINEIGSYVLVLPAKENRAPVVVHVEVKFSDPSDLSYVTMVIWRAAMNNHGFHNTAAICVQNDTDLPLTLLQDGIDFKMAGCNPRQFELCVGPGENLPFGWIDPMAGSRVRAVVDTSLVESIGQQVVIDLSKVGTECNLEMMHYSVELDSVQLIVKAGAGGRILHVIRKSLWEAEERSMQLAPSADFPEKENIFFKLNFHSIGLSLIAEKPIRRELFGVYIDGIDIRWSETAYIAPSKFESSPVNPNSTRSNSVDSNNDLTVTVVSSVQSSRSLRGKKTSLSVFVMDMQVDNYSETTVYPVLLHSYHSSERKEAARKKAIQSTNSRFKRKNSLSSTASTESAEQEDALNFVTFGMVKFVPQGSITATFKYLAVRVLEIKVAVDTSTLQLYFLDLHNDLIGESVEQVLATANPSRWINNFNSRTVVGDDTVMLVNVPRAQRHASVQRMYIEEFVIHPIKVRLSYTHTSFPRDASEDIFSSPQYRWVKFIQSVAGVDDFLFKLKSFIVSDALESTSSLIDRVVHIYVQDLKKHLVEIASQFVGSLRIIGKPVGLYRNIGAGVKDFYYEVASFECDCTLTGHIYFFVFSRIRA